MSAAAQESQDFRSCVRRGFSGRNADHVQVGDGIQRRNQVEGGACDSEMESLSQERDVDPRPLPKGTQGNRQQMGVSSEGEPSRRDRAVQARLVAKGFLQKYDIHMAQPDGYIDEVHPDYVCKLSDRCTD
ncbi:hypothetical protein Pcac1_g29148 [Phytophthora cactorum]|nr:hypothetical protein Pcac1_g29148 [Phytophthora cactorum]